MLIFFSSFLMGVRCNQFPPSNSCYTFNKDLKTEQDSVLQFIEYCDTKHFDNALALYSFVDTFSEENTYIYTTSGKNVPYDEFAFKEFTSNQCLLIGIYIDRKYQSNIRLLDLFLRNSIIKDTQNYISILELAKIGILGNDVLNTYCLLNFVKESAHLKKIAKEMREYCRKNSLGTITELPSCNEDLTWICNNVSFSRGYIDYEGHNKFSKYMRFEE